MSQRYQLIVIGSGPAGEGAAMKAAKGGWRVAVIEDKPRVGGNCTHTSTIPSKALRQAVQQLMDSGRHDRTRYEELLKTAQAVIDRRSRAAKSIPASSGRAERPAAKSR